MRWIRWHLLSYSLWRYSCQCRQSLTPSSPYSSRVCPAQSATAAAAAAGYRCDKWGIFLLFNDKINYFYILIPSNHCSQASYNSFYRFSSKNLLCRWNPLLLCMFRFALKTVYLSVARFKKRLWRNELNVGKKRWGCWHLLVPGKIRCVYY